MGDQLTSDQVCSCIFVTASESIFLHATLTLTHWWFICMFALFFCSFAEKAIQQNEAWHGGLPRGDSFDKFHSQIGETILCWNYIWRSILLLSRRVVFESIHIDTGVIGVLDCHSHRIWIANCNKVFGKIKQLDRCAGEGLRGCLHWNIECENQGDQSVQILVRIEAGENFDGKAIWYLTLTLTLAVLVTFLIYLLFFLNSITSPFAEGWPYWLTWEVSSITCYWAILLHCWSHSIPVYKSMASSIWSLEKCWHVIRNKWIKSKIKLPKKLIKVFVLQHHPTNQPFSILSYLLNSYMWSSF